MQPFFVAVGKPCLDTTRQSNPDWLAGYNLAKKEGWTQTETEDFILSAVNAIHRLRAIQGIIRLRDTYGEARLDAACARALQVGDPRYRTVKGILVAGTQHGEDPLSQHRTPTPPAMLRGPATFDTERSA